MESARVVRCSLFKINLFLFVMISFIGVHEISSDILDDGRLEQRKNETQIKEKMKSMLFGANQRVHYDGYKVVRTVPFTPLQLSSLIEMTFEVDFDFWSLPTSIFTPVDIFVSPSSFGRLQQRLRKNVNTFLINSCIG